MAYAYSDRLMPSKPKPPLVPPARVVGAQPTHRIDAPWLAVEKRLDELAALPANWNDEGSPPISASALHVTRQLLAHRRPLIGLGVLFPSPDGGVLIEYVRGHWDLTVEINADGSLEIFGFEIGGTLKLYPRPYPSLDAEFLDVLDAMGGPGWQ
ncbi:hypothetical protein [Mitsuaria sp. GD03876]|uniref:hypothetical protein n=1 Tax=Mitsuaria sp. GD03876 TaxID=2975399 RepID=UPI002446FEB2|nr:hypothetical protein [Mitsuaria sp. GD03876]MDH0865737.1 hypothetical protein [Mitsuaria sp. GD03876]